MKLFDCASGYFLESDTFPKTLKSNELFIICRSTEITPLRDVFGFDKSTILECTDLDESVRYVSFDGYDFISLVHMETEQNAERKKDFTLREINMYISSSFLVLVLPEHDSPRIAQLETSLFDVAASMGGVLSGKNAMPRLIRLYFLVFNGLLVDFSETMETLEDEMEELSEAITLNADKRYIVDIGRLRKIAYTAKKLLRSLSYLGTQILMDENGLIDKKYIKYFRNVDTRLKKLYDFSESLYELSNELLRTYDSRLTIKTNDTINKLTIITLFFGPLTVITGIYGMNFEVMPELSWPFGYPLTLGIMVLVSFIIYWLLKKNEWL
ncbi:cation transporter [Synergistales bacterium]|nr:cation transporter [Synergistales bacterium]